MLISADTRQRSRVGVKDYFPVWENYYILVCKKISFLLFLKKLTVGNMAMHVQMIFIMVFTQECNVDYNKILDF